MPSIDFTEVKRVVPLKTALYEVGWKAESDKVPASRGTCPICGGRSRTRPPFVVNWAQGVWYCHKCKRGGSVIDLAVALWGMTLYPAVQKLCKVVGVPVPYVRRRKRGVAEAPRNSEEEL